MTCGVPWPRGAVRRTDHLVLVGESGQRLPLQSRVLDRWPDGSARWTLLDWQATTGEDGARYRVGVADGGHASAAASAGVLEVEASPGGRRIAVDTGAAGFEMSVGGRFPFDRVVVGGEPALDTARGGLAAGDDGGRSYRADIERLEIEEPGPVRGAVALRGRLVSEGERVLAEVTARVHFFAGSATVRLEITLTNPRAAGHPGGTWGLGSAGSVLVRDASLILVLPGDLPSAVRWSPAPGQPWQETDERFEIYQESSGGERWQSRNHLDRSGRVALRFRGYRVRCGDAERAGRRASPIVAARRGAVRCAVHPREFWQTFPKAVEADGGRLVVGLLPEQAPVPHELQGGERTTTRLDLAFAEDRVTREPLDWCRAPLTVSADPEWYAASGAVPGLSPAGEPSADGYQRLVDQAIEGDDTFERKREAIDEYGWRNFGDLWADHEAAFAGLPEPPISHYNNQYDAVAGCAIQFLRSADPRWHRLMDELARHVSDIDLYHTSEDKSAYNHGMFWHTVHYADAGLSNHRSYPRDVGEGGGPSAGHLYTSGLMLHHFLTGSASSREAVIGLGRYVIDADDGTRTVFRWLDRGPTGHVTASGFDDYHGPGRSGANSLSALLDAHRLTGDRRFLDQAEQIVRRCIHPADDLAERNLLDAENRWFYTMFLQSLGKYLDHKAELGGLGPNYAYGRAALLHYAEWACRHEYPYLERPEKLEYPTETWAAQDMRKSEVFHFAARHATGELRRRLRERAEFFYHASVKQLLASETRSYCRPVVLLLSCGYRHQALNREQEPAPLPQAEWEPLGEPVRFRSQKERVKRKLVVAAAVAGGFAALALLLAW